MTEDLSFCIDRFEYPNRKGEHPLVYVSWFESKKLCGSPATLKGGYWGPVRTRCRPATRAHGPEHAFYQQGFRCCK